MKEWSDWSGLDWTGLERGQVGVRRYRGERVVLGGAAGCGVLRRWMGLSGERLGEWEAEEGIGEEREKFIIGYC